jgi:putative mRNA 3-end processing factor
MPGRTPTESSAAPRRLPSVVWRRGVHLTGTVLWFDAAGDHDLCFVSSACAFRPGRHRKVLCTAETATLLRARGARPRALTAPYGHPLQLGRLRLELVPSGHVLGGAQLLVQHEGLRILYTGTVATEAAPTATPLESRPADLVIAHAFCVPPDHPLETAVAGEAALLAFVRETLEGGAVPVLLVETLGQGQDVLRVVGDADVPLAAHQSVYRQALQYRECGERFPVIQRFRGTPPPGHVLVWPRRGFATAALRRLPNTRIAWLGYEERPPQGGPETAPIERVLPFGNLSTATALLGWLRSLEPQRVVFHGPFDRVLAERLRRESGVDAVALSQLGQLPLFGSDPVPSGRLSSSGEMGR